MLDVTLGRSPYPLHHTSLQENIDMQNDTHILFAWIGGSDRNAAGIPRDGARAKPDGPGPIARTLLEDTVAYAKVVLLSDNPDKDTLYKSWLERELKSLGKIPGPEIILVEYLGNPMDRGAVYEASRKAVEAHAQDTQDTRLGRTYILSSGTAVMHLCWTLLAHTHTYEARMVEPFVVRRDGVVVREGIDTIEPWIDLKQTFPQPPVYSLDELFAEEYQNAVRHSAAARQIIGVREQVGSAAKITRMPIEWRALILGESGTGKEAIARVIHEMDAHYRDRKGAFVAVNCGAIPKDMAESELFGHEKGAFTGAHNQRKGHIELARGGTLFLDEVGELTLDLQVKLLRFLQESAFSRVGGTEPIKADDIRVVAATNRDLAEEVRKGLFREDLYYRLDNISINLPPLRARREDIGRIAQRFVDMQNAKIKANVTMDAACFDWLRAYPWPGNIRQLQNFLMKAYVLVYDMPKSRITERVIKTFFDEGKIKPDDNPLSDANLYDIIADTTGTLSVKTWLDRIQYEGYRRLLDHQEATSQRNEKTRTWLFRKMGASSNQLLCGWEKEWLGEGKRVDPNRTCKDGDMEDESAPRKPGKTPRRPRDE